MGGETITNMTCLDVFLGIITDRGPPRGKRDGVIGHNSTREFVNWIEKWRYCVIWYPWRDRENSII